VPLQGKENRTIIKIVLVVARTRINIILVVVIEHIALELLRAPTRKAHRSRINIILVVVIEHVAPVGGGAPTKKKTDQQHN